MRDQKKRDYEKEREELLRLINKSVPREIMKAIEITMSAKPVQEQPEIKISHKGASDAD